MRTALALSPERLRQRATPFHIHVQPYSYLGPAVPPVRRVAVPCKNASLSASHTLSRQRRFTPVETTTSAFTKPWNYQTVASSSNDVQRVVPLSVLPYRMQISTQLIAVYPRTPSLMPVVDQFIGNMSILYPALNFSAIGGVGFSPSSGLRDLIIPSLSSVFKRFNSESDLQAYIKDTSYAFDNSIPLIYAAISFNQWDSGIYDYRCEIFQLS